MTSQMWLKTLLKTQREEANVFLREIGQPNCQEVHLYFCGHPNLKGGSRFQV